MVRRSGSRKLQCAAIPAVASESHHSPAMQTSAMREMSSTQFCRRSNFATHFQQQQQPNFCCCCCNEREAAKHHCQEKEKKVPKSRKTSKKPHLHPSLPSSFPRLQKHQQPTTNNNKNREGEKKIHAAPQKKRRDQSHNYSIHCRFPTLLLLVLLQHTIIPH